jgi:hypothetical protein
MYACMSAAKVCRELQILFLGLKCNWLQCVPFDEKRNHMHLYLCCKWNGFDWVMLIFSIFLDV